MVLSEPSPAKGISIQFENVIYAWEGDHEMVPFAYYDRGDGSPLENLGPIDMEMSKNGLNVFLDGVSDRAERLFRGIGGSGWAAIAREMHSQIPLAEHFWTPNRTYSFPASEPGEIEQAA